MNDFRIDSFEKVFAASLDEIEEIDKNFPELSDNQRLRAQQLLKKSMQLCLIALLGSSIIGF